MDVNLHIVASGSSANCYVLDYADKSIMIECGVNPRDALRMTNNIPLFCLISHKHKDHARDVAKLKKYGIQAYSNKDVPHCKSLNQNERYKIDDFTIMPLDVPHGDVLNYAYIIDHPLAGRVVFATDLSRFSYEIKDVSHLLIEANYDERILMDKLLDGCDVNSASDRHLNIEDCVEVVKRFNNSKLRTVVLLHLSAGLSNESQFIEKVSEVVPFADVYAANNDTTIILQKELF